MDNTYLNRRTALVSFAVALCTPLMATAQQAYPTKPIRIVIPAPAGTATDVVIRFLSDRITRQLGQPLVIDNRPGAATIIGAQAVSTAPADGYTLLLTIGSTTSINPYIYSKLPYKVEDFVPVSWVVSTPFVLVTGANSPYRSLQDLTRAAKEKSGGLSYASYGVGSTTHVAYAWLSNVANFQMTHVPYKDGGISDIVNGLVQSSIEPAATAVQFIKAGRLRGLAVTSAKRLEVLPDVPTLAESYPGIATDGWYALFAPRGTPANVISLVSSAFSEAVLSPEFKAKALELGVLPVGGSPTDLQRLMNEEAKTWSKVIKDNNIKAD